MTDWNSLPHAERQKIAERLCPALAKHLRQRFGDDKTESKG